MIGYRQRQRQRKVRRQSRPASERGTVEAPRRAPPEEHFTSRKLNAGFARVKIVGMRRGNFIPAHTLQAYPLHAKPVSRCAVCSALRCGVSEKDPPFQRLHPPEHLPFQKAFPGNVYGGFHGPLFGSEKGILPAKEG